MPKVLLEEATERKMCSRRYVEVQIDATEKSV